MQQKCYDRNCMLLPLRPSWGHHFMCQLKVGLDPNQQVLQSDIVWPFAWYLYPNRFMLGRKQFLSPPVHMHGGLLCIIFCMYVCLSVTWPKFRLEVKSLDTISRVKGNMAQCQRSQVKPKCHNIGRWAHINVKLHFSFLILIHVWSCVLQRVVSFPTQSRISLAYKGNMQKLNRPVKPNIRQKQISWPHHALVLNIKLQVIT